MHRPDSAILSYSRSTCPEDRSRLRGPCQNCAQRLKKKN